MKYLDQANSPLSEEQTRLLNQLAEALSPEQQQWVSGYLAALHTQVAGNASPASTTSADTTPTLTILFGSESGNAEALADQAGIDALALGLSAQVFDMADYKARHLRDERNLLIITATHGEGDPPDGARDFYEFLHSRKAPKLAGTGFAVLALGDTSYEHFCQTGRDFDARLETLGGERIQSRIDCDVDYDEPAAHWLEQVLKAFATRIGASTDRPAAAVTGRAATSTVGTDRRHPFAAEVLDSVCMSGRGSVQETWHIELSLEGSGLDYRPGDVLGVIAENREEVVSEILTGLSLSPDQPVAAANGDGEVTLANALRSDYELTTLTPNLVAEWARLSGSDELQALGADDRRSELMAFIEARQLLDLVIEYPLTGIDARALLAMLRRLQPREYSIASSHLTSPGEVHLTVAAVRGQRHGQPRYGVASTWLVDLAVPGERVPVFIRHNKNFKLPADPATPIVMIGPGTGIAPFRAFVQEREEQGATGGNWLFFGNPHFRTDFLYQTEWQRWLADGVLSRIDLAFSRDQADKVYVQHRMREHGAELYRWLQDGAHLYVCGDANRMAKDVEAALEDIVAEHGGLEADGAREYINALQRDKRYQRDVY